MIIAIFNPSTEYVKDGKTKIAYDNVVKQLDMPWENVVDLLLAEPDINDKKIDVSMVSGWEYFPPCDAKELTKYGGHTRKVMANLVRTSLIIVDYDDAIYMTDFIDKYHGMEYVMYSSFSHSNELGYDKFRVVIPVKEPIDIEQWNKMEKGLLEYFPNCDKTSFGQNRSFFLPHTTPAGRKDYMVYHNEGTWFDASVIPLKKDKPMIPVVRKIESSKTGTGKILWETFDVVGFFQQQGLYIEKDARNRHLVHCPWEHEHTSDTDGTAIWEATGLKRPGFNCIHHHCHDRSLYDITTMDKYREDAITFCEREVQNEKQQEIKQKKDSFNELLKKFK